jgi:hypothetical protein
MDLFAKKNPVKGVRSQEIKARVTAFLELSDDATVMVTELTCQDEDCPEVETVIAVFHPGLEKVQATLHCSIDEITEDEIEQFCRRVQNNLSGVRTNANVRKDDNQRI